MTTTLLELALKYAKHGWPVLPLWPGQKNPITEHGFKDATTDPGQIKAWWTRNPNANIAVRTGAESGLVALDFDVKKGQPGRETYADLERQHGQKALETLTSRTPSNGGHLLYKHPGVKIKTCNGLLPGLDIRGDGGYLILPGSVTAEGEYAFVNRKPPASLPECLLKLLTEGGNKSTTKKLNGATKETFDRESVLAGVPEGQRNDALFRLACSYQAKGYPQTENEVLIKQAAANCKPSYPEAEAVAIVKRVYETYGDTPDTLTAHEMFAGVEPTILSPSEAAKLAEGEEIQEAVADNTGYSKRQKNKEKDNKLLVQDIISRIGADNVIYALGYFWTWDKHGVWKKRDDRVIKQHAHSVLNNAGMDHKKTMDDCLLDLTKTETFVDDHQFDQMHESINVLNGELHMEAGQWVLKPHERLHYRTTQLPVQYDPQATAPRFQRFLAEVFAGDDDAGAKATMALELIGYTMLPTCRFEKFALLIGSGANGKSVLLAVVEALLGRKNVAAVQPSQFDNRFQRAHLHGKLANIVTEIAEGAEIADAQLKSIVSGELTTAEHKRRDPFEFRPVATCWFGTNHMPHTRDFSDALFRRAIVLTFPNKFEGDRCDPRLKEKLVGELPGILNLALAAIAGVLQWGQFTTCDSNEDAKRKWRLEADQAAQFLEECCERDTDSMVPSKVVYDGYKRWADDCGIARKLGRNSLTQRLERRGVVSGKGTNGVRMLYGIRVRDEWLRLPFTTHP